MIFTKKIRDDESTSSLPESLVREISSRHISGHDKYYRMFAGCASNLERYENGIIYLRTENTETEKPSNLATAAQFAGEWMRGNKELKNAKGFVVSFYKTKSTGFAMHGPDIAKNKGLLNNLVKQLKSSFQEEKVLVNVFSGLFTNSPVEEISQQTNLAPADEFYRLMNSVVKDIPGAKVVGTTKHYHRTTQATGQPDVKDEARPFRVLCDDMFHYQDSDARLFIGSYATLEEAKETCLSILLECLNTLYEPGMTASTLRSKWAQFGDDPWIGGGGEGVPFSAATQMNDDAFVSAFIRAKRGSVSARQRRSFR